MLHGVRLVSAAQHCVGGVQRALKLRHERGLRLVSGQQQQGVSAR